MNAALKLSLGLVSFCAAAACLASTSQPDQSAWPEGIYGNVELSEESGDLGGFEVRFFLDGDKRMAEFVYCEGWCSRAYVAEVTRKGERFHFSHVEEYFTLDTNGALTRTEGGLVEYSVVRAGDGLIYGQSIDGQTIAIGSDFSLLAPLDEPFGLSVAKGED